MGDTSRHEKLLERPLVKGWTSRSRPDTADPVTRSRPLVDDRREFLTPETCAFAQGIRKANVRVDEPRQMNPREAGRKFLRHGIF